MLFMTACTNVVKVSPPAQLLADCLHAVAPENRNNAGLAQYIQDEQMALDVCNTDKAALREFFR